MAVVAAVASWAVPAVAQAAPVPVSGLVAHPIAPGGACTVGSQGALDAPAATHRDFCVRFDLGTSGDDVRKLTIALPAGVVGDPGATPRCSFGPGNKGTCTTTQQVGQVDTTVSTILGDQDVTGEVYNLTPQPGEPARLGIALDGGLLGALSPNFLQSAIRVRVPDAGLDSVTDDIPRTAAVLGLPTDISVKAMALELWGGQNRHGSMTKAFMTLPTRCDVPASTTVTVVSYGGQESSASTSFPVSACDQVPFTPDLEIGPASVPSDAPVESWAKLILPTTDTGTGDDARRQAYVRDVALRLPAGLALNPPLANGLIPCQPAQFAADSDSPPGCPDTTVMGRVEFVTPMFPGETLTGKVYFGQPEPGRPLVNYISVEDPRLRIKLIGYATIDHDTTAITAHFENQPQVPFSSFRFIYTDPGDGRATLTSPVACGSYPVTAAMTPWGGGATQAPTRTFAVDGCTPPAFAPTLGATVSTTQAGAGTALGLHIERPDRQLRLDRLAVSLPPGLNGFLTAVPSCPVADARAASCPDASQVGTASVSVGTGPLPLRLPGRVYLTEGFDGGIAGLAVIVDTKLPALDLGRIAVLQRLVLRPDGGIDVVGESLPQQLEGIPTAYRSIDLTIDKPGFLRNATSCEAQTIHGSFAAVGGQAGATADAPYQATDCESLPFHPKMTARLGAVGQVGRYTHPPLVVTIEQGTDEASMARTSVTLPTGIGVDLKNLGALCTGEQLDASACPAASRIGSVTADTPLLGQPLSGGAYLLKPPTPGLPGIGLDLGLIKLRGTVAIKGRLTTTFDSVPDVPLNRLVLTLDGGPKGGLATSIDQCSASPAFDATFTGHNGASRAAHVAPEIVGCAVRGESGLTGTATLSGVRRHRPALALKIVAPTALRELRLALPTSLKASSSRRVRTAARLYLAGKRYKKGAKVRLTKGRIVVTAPKGRSGRSIQVTLPAGVLKLRHPIKVGQKVTFAVTVLTPAGKALTARVTVKAKA